MGSNPRDIPSTSKDAMVGDLSCAIGTGKPHAAGGIKTSFHGYIYQVKLAIFFIVRALKNNFIFDIGTEVDAAGSFDDLVLEFENETGKRVVFLQAKHRLDEGKTINEIDLLNEDGHFSMRKHYSSYGNILEAKYFKKILKDAKVTLVLCTNIGIDNSIEDKFAKVRDGEFAINGFLHPGAAAAYAKFYKIIPDTPFYDNLVYLLGKSELPSTLAHLLAKSVVNNKKKSIKIDDQFKRYRECLLNNIFDHGIDTVRKQNSYYVCFKEDFLLNKDLPADVLNFRLEFIQCFINERNILNNQYVTDETIKAELSGVKFTVTKDFIISGVTKQNKAKEFLDALIFAVNQPSEDKLGAIVEKEVGEYVPNVCKFQTYITDWVKQKEGIFLKKADVEEQFAVWGQTDQSHRHIDKVKSLGYIFEHDDVIVNVSNFLKYDRGQIICLYYSEQLLTEIKLCQALNYEENINTEFIFADICTLSEQVNTKMCPVKAFSSQYCNTVFIIIAKNANINNKEEMLLRRLLNIVKSDIQNIQQFGGKKSRKAKKRLLMLIPLKHTTINERKDFFQDLDSDGIQRIILEDAEVKFSNLNDDSRRKLFEKGLYKVVGNEIGGVLTDTLNDFTFQSICNAIRHNLKIQNKSINNHLDSFKDKLSCFIKDDVLTELISGDSVVYKDITNNYNKVTNFCSEKIVGDVLSTVITESTRTDNTLEEKAISFIFNGLSIITPVVKEVIKKIDNK